MYFHFYFFKVFSIFCCAYIPRKQNKTCFVVWSLGTYAKIYFCFFFEGFFWEGEWRPRDVCMTSKLLAIHGFLVLLFNLMGELRRYLSLLYNWWQWHLFGTRKSLGSQLCCPCFSKLILIFFFSKLEDYCIFTSCLKIYFTFLGIFLLSLSSFKKKVSLYPCILLIFYFFLSYLYYWIPFIQEDFIISYIYLQKKQLFWFLHSFFYNYIYACTFIKDLFVRRKKATLYIVWDLCIRLSNGYYPNNISVLGTFIGNLG